MAPVPIKFPRLKTKRKIFQMEPLSNVEQAQW